MFLDIFLFIVGIALAVIGATYLVEGASSIAEKLKVPQLIIGMTIVAFGTSLPELTVNVFASLQHQTGLAVSNILGSNIFNLFFILGVGALVNPLKINKNVRIHDVPMNFLAALIVATCGFKILLDGQGINQLNLSDGIVFLSLFVIFLYYTFAGIKNQVAVEEKEQSVKQFKTMKTALFIVGGLVGLIVGGEMLVEGAKDFATHSGMSDHLIGLIIVGPGTSIPEFVTTIIAIRKKRVDIAVGNVVGSNIFNVLFTLGISSIIYKLPLPEGIESAVVFHLFSALLFLVIIVLFRRKILSRPVGILFLLLYFGYIAWASFVG